MRGHISQALPLGNYPRFLYPISQCLIVAQGRIAEFPEQAANSLGRYSAVYRMGAVSFTAINHCTAFRQLEVMKTGEGQYDKV